MPRRFAIRLNRPNTEINQARWICGSVYFSVVHHIISTVDGSTNGKMQIQERQREIALIRTIEQLINGIMERLQLCIGVRMTAQTIFVQWRSVQWRTGWCYMSRNGEYQRAQNDSTKTNKILFFFSHIRMMHHFCKSRLLHRIAKIEVRISNYEINRTSKHEILFSKKRRDF